MTAPVSLDVEAQKRRMFVAMAISAICLLVASAALVGMFAYDVQWLVMVFVFAVAAGFAVQIWLVLGVMSWRAKK